MTMNRFLSGLMVLLKFMLSVILFEFPLRTMPTLIIFNVSGQQPIHHLHLWFVVNIN